MEAFETEEQQAEAIKKWFKENGKNLMTVVLIVATCVLGFKYWRHQQEITKIQASEHYMSLMESQMREDEQSAKVQAELLIESFSQTPYAQLAALYLAKTDVEAKDTEQALAHLMWVIEHGKVEEFSLVARARAARIYMDQQDFDQALAILSVEDSNGFTSVLDEVKGDIYIAQNDKQKAFEAYQSAMTFVQSKELDNPILKYKLQELGWVPSQGDDA